MRCKTKLIHANSGPPAIPITPALRWRKVEQSLRGAEALEPGSGVHRKGGLHDAVVHRAQARRFKVEEDERIWFLPLLWDPPAVSAKSSEPPVDPREFAFLRASVPVFAAIVSCRTHHLLR